MFAGILQDMYPGIVAGLTWGIGMFFMMIYTVMMTLLSMAMPRSAGLYQISARGFNPVTGILAVWRGIIANPIIKTSEFYMLLVILGSAFAQWGAAVDDAGLSAMGVALSSQSPMVLVAFSIALMAIFSVVAYLGPLFKIEPRLQAAGGLFSTIGWLMAIGVLLMTPSSAVSTRWDSIWQAGAYQEVIDVSTATGFVPAPFTLEATLLGTIWPIAIVWPYLILLYGGEVSDPAKNLVLTQVVGGIILSVMLAGGAALFQGTFGDFTSRFSWCWYAGNPGLTLTPFFSGSFGGFTAVLAANPVISGWILLSPVVIGLTATPINMAWVTRGFFQLSLDRMMPGFFGHLSRYHTPTYAILYYFLFGAPFSFLYMAGMSAVIGTLTSIIALWGIEMIVQSMAGLSLPFLNRPLYEGSIRKQWEIAGVPVMSLLAIITLPLSLFILIGFCQGVAFLATISMCAQYGFSALWFLFYAHRLRKKNIEIESIYKSLSPE